MDNIKQAVDDFKQQNGNINMPNKDLIIYLITKFDNLPCEEHVKTIQANSTRSKILLWVNGIIVTALLVLVGKFIQLY